MFCDRDHTSEISKSVFSALPESQRGAWRHACAGCAYLLGVQHGQKTEERLRQRVRDLEARIKLMEGATMR